MSDASYAVQTAQETLDDAIVKAINTHFEAGISCERERIIKLLEADCKDGLGDHIQGCSHEVAIALIKEETDVA